MTQTMNGPGEGQHISDSPAAKFARRLAAEATQLIAENPRLDIRSAIVEVLRSDEGLAESYRRLLHGYSNLTFDEKADHREQLHAEFRAGTTTRGILKFLERF